MVFSADWSQSMAILKEAVGRNKTLVAWFRMVMAPWRLLRTNHSPDIKIRWKSELIFAETMVISEGREIMWYCGWLRNPAPVDRWFIPLLMGFQPSFWWCRISLAHPQYHQDISETKTKQHWFHAGFLYNQNRVTLWLFNIAMENHNF